MSLYNIKIAIDGLPQRINQSLGASWQVRYAESKKWQRKFREEMVRNSIVVPREPLKHAKLVLIRYSSKSPDYDGLVHSFKPVIDAIKKLGIIEDDNMQVIGRPEYRWEKCPPNCGSIEITVSEFQNSEEIAGK